MRRTPWILLLALAVLTPALAGGIDIDLAGAVRVGDDTDLYFGISSRYFDREPAEVRSWGGRYHDPDDLAVALFIASRTGRPLDLIFTLRRGGTTWWDVGARCGLAVDAWFVPVSRAPGPPYGKAYGHWKKRGGVRAAALSDVDARNLVAVRMIHEYYGVPVDVAMDLRASGRDIRTLVNGEYRKRHGHDKAGPPTQGHGPAKGKAKPKPKHKKH